MNAEQQRSDGSIPVEERPGFRGEVQAPSVTSPELVETVTMDVEHVSSSMENARKLREEQAAAARAEAAPPKGP